MAATRIVGLGAAGLGLIYTASHCIFNVESGKRGIVYNRIGGIKDTVRPGAPFDCTASELAGASMQHPGLWQASSA